MNYELDKIRKLNHSKSDDTAVTIKNEFRQTHTVQSVTSVAALMIIIKSYEEVQQVPSTI